MGVSWYEAARYCRLLSERESCPIRALQSSSFRLPMGTLAA